MSGLAEETVTLQSSANVTHKFNRHIHAFARSKELAANQSYLIFENTATSKRLAKATHL